MIFTASFINWATKQKGKSKKFSRRLFIIGIFLVLLLMFNSSGSLTLIDGLILLLTMAGLGFYFDRRST